MKNIIKGSLPRLQTSLPLKEGSSRRTLTLNCSSTLLERRFRRGPSKIIKKRLTRKLVKRRSTREKKRGKELF
jgi:hypothetical protein